jgi:hypothetical protein
MSFYTDFLKTLEKYKNIAYGFRDLDSRFEVGCLGGFS